MFVGTQVEGDNFNLNGITETDYAAGCDQIAPAFAAVPGLVTKVWLADSDAGVYGACALSLLGVTADCRQTALPSLLRWRKVTTHTPTKWVRVRLKYVCLVNIVQSIDPAATTHWHRCSVTAPMRSKSAS